MIAANLTADHLFEKLSMLDPLVYACPPPLKILRFVISKMSWTKNMPSTQTTSKPDCYVNIGELEHVTELTDVHVEPFNSNHPTPPPRAVSQDYKEQAIHCFVAITQADFPQTQSNL